MELIKTRVVHQFVRERLSLSWREIKFGLDNELLDPGAPIDFAIEQAVATPKPPSELLDLAAAASGDSIYRMVDRLAGGEPQGSEDQARQKWLFLVLAWIYAHRDEFDDPLRTVADVYADFGYPEELASFVHYMPVQDSEVEGQAASVDDLYERWKHYLEEAGRRFRF